MSLRVVTTARAVVNHALDVALTGEPGSLGIDGFEDFGVSWLDVPRRLVGASVCRLGIIILDSSTNRSYALCSRSIGILIDWFKEGIARLNGLALHWLLSVACG